MPNGGNAGKPGLGTGIVEALGKQLGGRIQVVDASPGTAFTLVHEELAGDIASLRTAA
jgi:two-component sensor histidine kinase